MRAKRPTLAQPLGGVASSGKDRKGNSKRQGMVRVFVSMVCLEAGGQVSCHGRRVRSTYLSGVEHAMCDGDPPTPKGTGWLRDAERDCFCTSRYVGVGLHVFSCFLPVVFLYLVLRTVEKLCCSCLACVLSLSL